MDALSAFLIFVGAGCGALLRWMLALALNPLLPALPLGTLAANLIGCLLMGLALGLFAQFDGLSPALRLAVTTGFLGGLTTFSAFSADISALLLRAQYGWAGLAICAHVLGSVLATLVGLALVRMMLGAPTAA
jgi:fluoride exporter